MDLPINYKHQGFLLVCLQRFPWKSWKMNQSLSFISHVAQHLYNVQAVLKKAESEKHNAARNICSPCPLVIWAHAATLFFFDKNSTRRAWVPGKQFKILPVCISFSCQHAERQGLLQAWAEKLQHGLKLKDRLSDTPPHGGTKSQCMQWMAKIRPKKYIDVLMFKSKWFHAT